MIRLRILAVVLSVVMLQLSCWIPSSASSTTTSAVTGTIGTAGSTSDFNDDGHSDLATGAWGSNQEAGAVHILYGSDAGLPPQETSYGHWTPPA